MPESDDPELAKLITVPFNKNNVMWGIYESFKLQYIEMEQIIYSKGDCVQYGLRDAIGFLLEHSTGSLVIFTNLRAKSLRYLHELEHKLNEAHCDVDTILINGH